jgi:hypothetical protein
MEQWLGKNTEDVHILHGSGTKKVILRTTDNPNNIQARFLPKYVIISEPAWLLTHVLGSDSFVINPGIQVYCCAIQLIRGNI